MDLVSEINVYIYSIIYKYPLDVEQFNPRLWQ